MFLNNSGHKTDKQDNVIKRPAFILYLAATILLWSATPALATIALKELDNFQLLFFVSSIATVSLFIMTVFLKKLPILIQYTKKDLATMFLMGIIGIFLYHTCLFGSFTLAPAGQVNVANYLWPVFIVIFSIPILKEKFNWKTILAVVLSFVGVVLSLSKGTFSEFDTHYLFGYFLASLGAVCYGLFSVLGKKHNYDRVTSMFVYYASATILIIPTTISVSTITMPQSLSTIITVIILGVVMNSVAFIMWFKTLKLGNTHITANAVYAIPFLAMVWTYYLNAEPLAPASIAGLALIILGISVQVKNKHGST